MVKANRSRARMANAWQTPSRPGKTSKRAAAVAASEAISAGAILEMGAGDEAPGGGGGGGSGSKKRGAREGDGYWGVDGTSSGENKRSKR